jgi:hypothetical protein
LKTKAKYHGFVTSQIVLNNDICSHYYHFIKTPEWGTKESLVRLLLLITRRPLVRWTGLQGNRPPHGGRDNGKPAEKRGRKAFEAKVDNLNVGHASRAAERIVEEVNEPVAPNPSVARFRVASSRRTFDPYPLCLRKGFDNSSSE